VGEETDSTLKTAQNISEKLNSEKFQTKSKPHQRWTGMQWGSSLGGVDRKKSAKSGGNKFNLIRGVTRRLSSKGFKMGRVDKNVALGRTN